MNATQLCIIRVELEREHRQMVDRLSVNTPTLIDLAGNGKSDAFWNLKHRCEALRLDIQSLMDQIATHRSEHGC